MRLFVCVHTYLSKCDKLFQCVIKASANIGKEEKNSRNEMTNLHLN